MEDQELSASPLSSSSNSPTSPSLLSSISTTLRKSKSSTTPPTTTPKALNRKSKIFGFLKGGGNGSGNGQDTIAGTTPPPPPPMPRKPLLKRGPSLILPSHICITVVFPTDGWLLDLKIPKAATAENIWGAIALQRKVEDQENYGLFTEKGVMMLENVPIVSYKVKNKDLLMVKQRLKKDVKQQVRTVLSTFLKRRVTVDMQEVDADGLPKKKVPINASLLHTCMDYLISVEAYKCEGIFRLSPAAVELQIFFESMMKSEPDFSLVTAPHTVAAAIKQYIRCLPTMLIFHPVSSAMASKLRDCADDKVVLEREFCTALVKLPPNHLEMLEVLFGFLLLVVHNNEYSKMTSRNLAIVFGPNLISFEDTVDSLTQVQVGTEVVDAIISNWENIYGRLSAIKRI